MTWVKRTSSQNREADFLDAVLPEWFAQDIDAGTPKEAVLEKLTAFVIDAETSVAAEENRAPAPAPTPDYIAQLYTLYTNLLHDLREGA